LKPLADGQRSATVGPGDDSLPVPALDPAKAGSRAGTTSVSFCFPRVRWRDPGLMACNPFRDEDFHGGVGREVSQIDSYFSLDAKGADPPCVRPEYAFALHRYAVGTSDYSRS